MLGIYLRKMKLMVEILFGRRGGRGLKGAGEEINRQSQDHRIEEEGQDTMQQGHAPHRPRGDLDVRYLACHPDYE